MSDESPTPEERARRRRRIAEIFGDVLPEQTSDDAAEPETRPATVPLEHLPWTQADARAQAAEKRAEARAKGYEGEACGECGNFTLVRNGTCLKCDT